MLVENYNKKIKVNLNTGEFIIKGVKINGTQFSNSENS